MRASVAAIYSSTSCLPRKRGYGPGRLANALAYVELIWAVHRERGQLKNLDARMLKDLGLTREMVVLETSRHILDVPANR